MSDTYKGEVQEMTVNESIFAGLALRELSEYFGKYEITFQFWGRGLNTVFIEKDGIDLWDAGSYESPFDAMLQARNYLDKINKRERDYNPNF